MKLIKLSVYKNNELIRAVPFKNGLNLIVNSISQSGGTGNSVGKSTPSRLLDYLFLSSGEDIYTEAEFIRTAFAVAYPISDEEFMQVKRVLASNILHSIGNAISLKGKDSEHQSWYYVRENDEFYWNRYRTYLKSIKH